MFHFVCQGKRNRQSIINFVTLNVYRNNRSNEGGTLELPYSIRFFQRVKIRMECRDPVLFSFLKRFYVLEQRKLGKNKIEGV